MLIVAANFQDGCYQLHVACQTQQTLPVLQLVVTIHPEAIEARDEDGWYPLHYACLRKTPLPVIQYLFEKWALYKSVYHNEIRKNPYRTLG